MSDLWSSFSNIFQQDKDRSQKKSSLTLRWKSINSSKCKVPAQVSLIIGAARSTEKNLWIVKRKFVRKFVQRPTRFSALANCLRDVTLPLLFYCNFHTSFSLALSLSAYLINSLHRGKSGGAQLLFFRIYIEAETRGGGRCDANLRT